MSTEQQSGTPQETGGTRPNESGAQQGSTPPATPYVVERGSGASVVWPQPDSQ